MAVKNAIAPQAQHKVQFQAFIKNEAVLKNISTTLGSQTRTNKFVASIISAVSTNQTLQECNSSTIISSALLGEALNLSPSPQLGHYYLMPFNDKKTGTKNASFVLGYKGYIQLAIRSGQYKKLNVIAIKEGELISYNPLDEELQVELIEDEFEREQRNTIGYYAMFELVNGFKKTMYWSKQKMLAHADKYSSAFSASKYQDLIDGKIPQGDLWKYSSFWYKDFDGMAFKTMLRQLISKWGIMSIDLQTAIEKDMTFQDEQGNSQYIDNDNVFDAEPVEPQQPLETEAAESTTTLL